MHSHIDDRFLGEEEESLRPPAGAVAIRHPSLMEILWRRQRTLIAISLVCMVAALAYLLVATPIYTSSSRIYVEQNGPKLLDERQEGVLTRSDTYLYTQAEILRSVPILLAALNSPGVASAKIFSKVDNKLVYLKKVLAVDVGKRDDIISVSVDSPDPQEAALVVNAVVNSYITYESKQKRSTASEVLKVLAGEKDKHEAELERQQDALLAFKAANGDVFYKTEKGNIVMQDLATVSDELAKARLACAQAEAVYQTGNNRTYTAALVNVERERVLRFERVYELQQAKALSLNVKTAEYEKLLGDIARSEKIIELLDSRMKEVNVTEDAGPLNINILEEARAMDKPSSPRRALTMAIALLAGLVLGTGGALVHDWMDQRLRSAKEVNDLLGLEVLGVVPSIKLKAGVPAQRQVQLEPMSDVAEAYRSVRTAIHFRLPDRSVKTILITSPSPGDGKSTSASNLAIALAQSDRRTLLIDADLRKPTQHKIFSTSNKMGISEFVRHQLPLDQVIQRTQIEGLDLMSSGAIPHNPAEILNSRAFTELLERVAEEYDQVIVDSPPVLPVTDARILGALCDVTVLVLRAEKSTRTGSSHACERLINVGSKLIGAIVNDVPRRSSGYGQYGGYEHYYQYGYGRREDQAVSSPAGANGFGNGNGNGHGDGIGSRKALGVREELELERGA